MLGEQICCVYNCTIYVKTPHLTLYITNIIYLVYNSWFTTENNYIITFDTGVNSEIFHANDNLYS